MKIRRNTSIFSPLTSCASAVPLCTDSLQHLINASGKPTDEVIFLCIGTDRIIGDSLGPLVGSMLLQLPGQKSSALRKHSLFIYGTLQNTIHALNLPETVQEIKKKHPESLLIAIDASLGAAGDVGSVFVRTGHLHPGAGVHKKLPALGDISITGIAAEESRHPYLSLQTVRLSTVMQMAETIRSCILDVCL